MNNIIQKKPKKVNEKNEKEKIFQGWVKCSEIGTLTKKLITIVLKILAMIAFFR